MQGGSYYKVQAHKNVLIKICSLNAVSNKTVISRMFINKTSLFIYTD
jgi:hypothetical protein